MKSIHPHYVVDEHGAPQSVVLAIDEFRSLLESAGVLANELTGPASLRIAGLGWTREEALETRTRLRSFQEDWEAPGMEAYDRL